MAEYFLKSDPGVCLPAVMGTLVQQVMGEGVVD